MLKMPETGEMVEQGGPEDRATWMTCDQCGFWGPNVGYDDWYRPACLGSCGGVSPNPAAPRLPGSKELKEALKALSEKSQDTKGTPRNPK